MREQAVLQDLLGAQAVAAMHQDHLAGELGQEQRLLDRGVAAADHHHLAVAIEEPVAGRAGTDAEALELLLGRQAQPARLRAGRQDHRIRRHHPPAVASRGERAALQVQRGHQIGHDLGTHRAGMGLHLDHQLGALDLGLAGPVLDLGRDGQLSAGLHALDQHRLQHGAGGIDGGGVTRRARSHDQKFHMAAFGHLAPLSRFVHEVVPHAPDCNASPPRSDVDKIVAPDGAAL